MHMIKINYNCPKIIQQQSYLRVFLILCWWDKLSQVPYSVCFTHKNLKWMMVLRVKQSFGGFQV